MDTAKLKNLLTYSKKRKIKKSMGLLDKLSSLLGGIFTEGNESSKSQIDIDYDPQSKTLTIIGHGAIPDDWQGWPRNAMYDKLIIQDGITSIGKKAFAGICVKSIIIGNGCTVIKEGAFEAKEIQVLSLHLGNSILEIQSEAFYNRMCIPFYIPDGIKSIGTKAFFYTMKDFNGFVSPKFTLKCACQIPPSIQLDSFPGKYRIDCHGDWKICIQANSIIIPKGCLKSYISAPIWNTFDIGIFQEEKSEEEILAEQEAARKQAEEKARQEAEKARKEAERMAREKAQEEARKKAEAEAKRLAKEEAARKKEEELARKKAEAEARKKAEAEAKRLAKEEAARKKKEELAHKEAEAKRLAERKAKLKAEMMANKEYQERLIAEEMSKLESHK